MKSLFSYHISAILFTLVLLPGVLIGQSKKSAHISGNLSIDSTWDSNIYLSHISNYDEMYSMSNEMIISKTEIDSLGYFKFNLDFLPQGENLYRLHLIKKGDTPATLIIGGKDENHLFLISNSFSTIQLTSKLSYPPFKNVTYKNSLENTTFQQITQLVLKMDSIASESSASKRSLIESQLNNDLLLIADTSSSFLISLYAIYKTPFESNYSSNTDFYQSYLKKWKNQDNTYFNTFSKKIPKSKNSNSTIINLFLALFLTIIGFFFGKRVFKKPNKLEKLSIQERKIYELLKQGATNQEISNELNIGLSTVKSHASSIYSKLKVKSRKDIINMK